MVTIACLVASVANSTFLSNVQQEVGFPHADVYLYTDGNQAGVGLTGKYTIGSDERLVVDSSPNYDVTTSGGTFTV